ncbi:MAG: phage holin family protein [bacterium]|nr:phage holin family protein [bacterium]
METVIGRFIVRWLVSISGLALAQVFSDAFNIGLINFDERVTVLIGAGFVLALVNSIIKPVLVVFSLSAVFFTLGLFMLVINSFTVWLAAWLYDPFVVEGISSALLAALTVSLVNYMVSAILEKED